MRAKAPSQRPSPAARAAAHWLQARAFQRDYGAYASVADVLRRIALDEGQHRDESLARIEVARFPRTPRVSLV